jgi:hypothetical protein
LHVRHRAPAAPHEPGRITESSDRCAIDKRHIPNVLNTAVYSHVLYIHELLHVCGGVGVAVCLWLYRPRCARMGLLPAY